MQYALKYDEVWYVKHKLEIDNFFLEWLILLRSGTTQSLG